MAEIIPFRKPDSSPIPLPQNEEHDRRLRWAARRKAWRRAERTRAYMRGPEKSVFGTLPIIIHPEHPDKYRDD